MRVTLNSSLTKYLTSLNTQRDRVNIEQTKIATGKQIQAPSDKPRAIGEIKRLTSTIGQNEIYKKSIEDGLTDTLIYEEILSNFADTLLNSKFIAQEAANPTNYDKLGTLGQRFLDLINDMVEIANYEFDGRFAFAGTQTTRNSIQPTGVETNNLPFELVEDPALVSSGNPLGLRVAFKGNNQDRLISTSANTTERINPKAEDAFGTGGTQVFENLISAYNIIAFNSDGSTRDSDDFLNAEEAAQLHQAIKNIGDSIDTLNSEIGRLGGVANRMTALSNQLTFENTRLENLRSLREDTDIIQAAVALKNEQNSLDATLQISSSFFGQSLLDFLR